MGSGTSKGSNNNLGPLNLPLNKEMIQMKQETLLDTAQCLKVIHDELWSCQFHGITVYDRELKQIRHIRGDFMDYDNWVLSVTLLPNDTVAVAGCHELYQISTSGDLIQTIEKSKGCCYIDLATYRGQLYAVCRDCPLIHVYNCNTWQLLRTISPPHSEAKHITNSYMFQRLCVNSTQLSLSCWDTIYILDKKGRLKQSYGPNIALANSPRSGSDDESIHEDSNLNFSYICQMDDDGAMLVADSWNDRLLMLTATGKWRRVVELDKLDVAIGAVWWRGRLYVSTRDADSKLTMFQ